LSLISTISQDVDSIFAINSDFVIPAIHVNGPVNETIQVLFDRTRELLLEADMALSTAQISIQVRTADMMNTDKDSQFTIEGQLYFVLEIQEDVEDVTAIILTLDQKG